MTDSLARLKQIIYGQILTGGDGIVRSFAGMIKNFSKKVDISGEIFYTTN